MRSKPADSHDLTGLDDAGLADLNRRAALLREWIAAVGSDELFDGGGLYTPISVTAVLGRSSADDLARGLGLRSRLLCLLALGVGLSAELGDERFADERIFESLRELNRVVLKEAVAGLTVDRASERLVAASDVSGCGAGVGVDPRPQHLDDMDRPRVHGTGELLAANLEDAGVDGPIGHGSELLSRLRIWIGKNSPAVPEAPLAPEVA